jgi:hypothetical protein
VIRGEEGGWDDSPLVKQAAPPDEGQGRNKQRSDEAKLGGVHREGSARTQRDQLRHAARHNEEGRSCIGVRLPGLPMVTDEPLPYQGIVHGALVGGGVAPAVPDLHAAGDPEPEAEGEKE